MQDVFYRNINNNFGISLHFGCITTSWPWPALTRTLRFGPQSETTLTCVCCRFCWWWLLCLSDPHCGPCQNRQPHGAAAYDGKRSSEETSCTGYYGAQNTTKEILFVIFTQGILKHKKNTHILYYTFSELKKNYVYFQLVQHFNLFWLYTIVLFCFTVLEKVPSGHSRMIYWQNLLLKCISKLNPKCTIHSELKRTNDRTKVLKYNAKYTKELNVGLKGRTWLTCHRWWTPGYLVLVWAASFDPLSVKSSIWLKTW